MTTLLDREGVRVHNMGVIGPELQTGLPIKARRVVAEIWHKSTPEVPCRIHSVWESGWLSGNIV